MKHICLFPLIFALLAMFLFAGCHAEQQNEPKPSPSAAATPTPAPTSTPMPTPTPAPTPTPHPWSEAVTGVPFYDLADYFVDVALHTEYSENGSMAEVLLSRWAAPIYYELSGPYTVHDYMVLDDMIKTLNQTEGFPGIFTADADHTANLTISFLSRQEMDARTSQYGSCDGFATYQWYNANQEIHHADILYCTDMDDSIRDGVLCEELIQVLGLSNDSEKYPDSIFYQYDSTLSWPAPIDWALFELLYHPNLQLGMTEDQARLALNDLFLSAP